MKRLILAALFFASTAHAFTIRVYFKYEITESGFSNEKTCVYGSGFKEYYIRIKTYQSCPYSIEVEQ